MILVFSASLFFFLFSFSFINSQQTHINIGTHIQRNTHTYRPNARTRTDTEAKEQMSNDLIYETGTEKHKTLNLFSGSTTQRVYDCVCVGLSERLSECAHSYDCLFHRCCCYSFYFVAHLTTANVAWVYALALCL